MEKIIEFLNAFFKAEIDAHQAWIRPDNGDFNNKIKIMDSFLVEELQQKFGMRTREIDKAGNTEYFEEFKNTIYASPRHIYKIAHYVHPKYNDVYLCYVSGFLGENPKFKWLGDCLFVSKEGDEFKIVKTFWWDENSFRTNMVWKEFKGYSDLTMKEAGKRIQVKRFMSPDEDQEKDVKQYLKNT